MAQTTPLPRGLYAGVFLITLSGLLFEIGLTRIYSATIWYHFAFVAISVPCSWGPRRPAGHALRLPAPPDPRGRRALHAALLAAAIQAASGSSSGTLQQSAGLLLRGLPAHLLLAGMALSIVFDRHRADAGRLYFARLLWASLGAVARQRSCSRGRGGRGPGGRAPAGGRRRLPLAAPWLPSAAVALLILAALVTNEKTGLFMIRSAPTKGDVPAHGRETVR